MASREQAVGVGEGGDHDQNILLARGQRDAGGQYLEGAGGAASPAVSWPAPGPWHPPAPRRWPRRSRPWLRRRRGRKWSARGG